MECDEVFTVLSICFAPVERDEWEQLVGSALWSDFLDAVARCGSQDEAALADRDPMVRALLAPPSYDEKRAFAARHFTGGLPESAVPVESLYTAWSNGSLPSPFSKAGGMYQGDAARYLRDLVERLGLEVPPQFAACPDHLALELDLVAVLLRSGRGDAALQFAQERFSWLAVYRRRLLELADDARFYIALIDVILDARERLAPTTGA
ncbi:molecular chaperone TorD family protein [Eggerthella sp. NSJ-70]|uniref:Molecular chaperone TorD family protein n=1 Tax=Eggerthella hominis TaxID=2763043 RepID=A0ABR7BVZ4_9ACTN|nr:molecular chaperone TorD family protein [Eggerthella hominis]MBC5585783.1 molecular chaperone TorD family protein [Eggerthella hominis]